MAKEFPESMFYGFDNHAESIKIARQRAVAAGVTGNVHFSVVNAAGYSENNFDLICFMDCLHDMGDPVGVARHAHRALQDDGTVLLVEPAAADAVNDNINPVSRLYYAASTAVCTPCSRSQKVGLALGAQAGERRLSEVMQAAGFKALRRATETPFNLVLEARPE